MSKKPENFLEGVSNFANNIAGGVSKAFLGSENTIRSLSDAAQRLYNTLDKTAHRTYINTGFSNNDKTKPNNRNIITQTPEMIVLITKRMFSTLSDNYNYEVMDEEEKHFIRAAKKLFENKCQDISSYEKLTKLNKIVQDNQVLNSPIAQMIYQTLNTLDGNEYNLSNDDWFPSAGEVYNVLGKNPTQSWAKEIFKNRNIIKRLRQLLSLNGFNQTTTWINDSIFEPKSSTGKGTGVIELTIVKNANFTTSLEFDGGGGSFTLSNPYKLLFVDEADIEKAIFQTSTMRFNTLDTVGDELQRETEELQQQLNSLRQARGASPITYKIDIRTRIYNRISIILDRIGLELTNADGSGIDYEKLDNPSIPDFEAFRREEKTLLNDIYKKLFKVIGSKIRNYEDYKQYNYQSNNVRKQMRLNFMGKQIIQPMDKVTVFVDSQTVDDKALAFELKQSFLNSSANIISNSFNSLVGANILPKAGNVASSLGSTNLTGLLSKTLGQINHINNITAEKNILAGPDFPDWLYNALRPNFTSQSFGTCIFSGIVRSVSESYSDGIYDVNVQCGSNADYFDQGYIQIKPGIDQFNGELYDPITPFDFDFDEANGLLPETSQFKLLPENTNFVASGLFKFEDGRLAGETITQENFLSSDFEPKEGLSKLTGTNSNISKRIFQAPDGFVYKWKKGIGTAFVNQSSSPDGLINNKLLHEQIANVTQEDAFGGQDLANVLSMLICGEPYNFNTFIKGSLANENVLSDKTFDPNTDYFQGLLGKIKRQNKIWGNYIPFKKMDVDPETFSRAINMQLSNFAKNSKIKKLQAERAALLQNLMQIEGDSFAFDISNYSAPPPSEYRMRQVEATDNSISYQQGYPRIKTSNRSITFQLIRKIVQLDAEIQLNELAIQNNFNKTNTFRPTAVIGTNLFYDQNIIITGQDAKNNYKLSLAKQNELTRRRLWQVKGNSDQNLFIIGSEYDNDYDIQALLSVPASDMSYVNVSWTKPIEKIREVSKIVGMELFVNSQGHIEFRAPRYNRIPSSILFEMLRKKKEYGVQIYPNFLEKSFKNKVESVFTDIEIIEDQIRIKGIALGAKYDGTSTDIENLLKGNEKLSKNNDFKFVTDGAGNLSSIREAVNQIDKDYSEAYKPKSNPSTLSKITGVSITNGSVDNFFQRKSDLVKNFQTAANTFNNFDIIQQNATLKDAYKKFNADKSFFQTQSIQAESIRARLAKKLGVPLDSASIDTIPKLLPNSKNGKLSPIDVDSIIRSIESLLTKRYELLATAINLIKSLDQAARMNSENPDIYKKLLMPNLYGNEDIPEFLQHMIENELEDDYGFNSGKRFVIKESDIITMTYKEETPDFTSISVSGAEVGGVASGIGGFQQGNVGMSQAWAVDYDLWRMYGSKEATGRNLPFFSDAEGQLAPYAVYLLNQQRANIFRGQIKIRGNEFVQPGEVYYIQERGMLFYSRSVTHDFSYGNSFSTTIDLCYGRTPGEYIPTPLDVIGKNLYNGHHLNTGSYKVVRKGTSGSDKKIHIGTFVFPNLQDTDMTPRQQLFANDVGEKNRQVKENILAKVNLLLDKTLPVLNTGMQALTIRIYSHPFIAYNQNLYEAAKEIVDYLINKGVPKANIVGKDYYGELIPGDVMIVNIEEDKFRNPSSLAFSYVKEKDLIRIATTEEDPNLLRSSDKDIFLNKLCNSIIDVFFENDIVANEAIVKSATQNPGDSAKSTTKEINFEQMREHFNKFINNDLKALIGE